MFYTVTEKKKRGGRRVVGTSVDLSNLTSGYYQSVIGGLAFVNNIASKGESKTWILTWMKVIQPILSHHWFIVLLG